MIYLDDVLEATKGTLHGAGGATEFSSFAFEVGS